MLVNVTLKFPTVIIWHMPICFVEKMWGAFAVAPLIFLTKTVSVFGNKVVKCFEQLGPGCIYTSKELLLSLHSFTWSLNTDWTMSNKQKIFFTKSWWKIQVSYFTTSFSRDNLSGFFKSLTYIDVVCVISLLLEDMTDHTRLALMNRWMILFYSISIIFGQWVGVQWNPV